MSTKRFFYFVVLLVAQFASPQSANAQLLTGYDGTTEVMSFPNESILTPPPHINSQPIQPATPIQPLIQPTLTQPVPLTPPPTQIASLPSDSSVEVFPLTGPIGDIPVQQQPLMTSPVMNQPTSSDQQPVDLEADNLSFDENANVITASGNVMLEQADRILRADQISYNLTTDTVYASGNVVVNDVNGDVYLADNAELRDKLKDGVVNGLHGYLVDGSRFTSEQGERKGGVDTVMKDATYTACEPCKSDPEKAPLWQIKADEVRHEKEQHRIVYDDATFELAGVPIFYTPYLSHSDGTIKRKSGLLAPTGGYKSQLGLFVTDSYYFDIAPDKDATLGVMAMTEEAPLILGEWRQRWENAELTFAGGLTYSKRPDSEGGVTVTQDEEVRGHIAADGLWDINDKWRAGTEINWASDDQYLRQYDLPREDVLTSQLYAERFDGRDYASGRLITFQDIRVNEEQEDQPQVLPELYASFIGEPGDIPMIGGRWDVQASALGLRRTGSEQDMNRLSLDMGWKRRLVSDYGLVTDAMASVRTDTYNVSDREVANITPGRSRDASEVRVFPQMHLQSSYPVAKQFEKSQLMIEPIAAVTIAPNVDVNSDIPNEDSQDVQIDATNLFEPNRFPGLDRVEDQSRVTYGVRTGFYGYQGSYGSIFLGQSHRLSQDDNPFPSGSGLDDQSSDIVGQIKALVDSKHALNYSFQLDNENYSSQRHEVDLGTQLGDLTLSANYLFAKALEGTTIDESREQLTLSTEYKVTPEWGVRLAGKQDLGQDPGLRTAAAGIDYYGQCLSWSVTGVRNLTDDASGESDTEIVFRIGLKNLGEFQSAGF